MNTQNKNGGANTKKATYARRQAARRDENIAALRDGVCSQTRR